ncbi:MAG TPA: hypothetical protein VGN63_23055 [Flavisolibacter sp.]|jgi:hypothetical protein|nr:hypothetical protein [Flavisolibacter sp.]
MKLLIGTIIEINIGIGVFKNVAQGAETDKQQISEKDIRRGSSSLIAAYNTYKTVYAKIYIPEIDKKYIEINIQETLKKYYQWSKITENRVSKLNVKLKGKQVKVVNKYNRLEIENFEYLL